MAIELIKKRPDYENDQGWKILIESKILSDYETLGAVLLYEYSKGEKSIWKPYIDSLPEVLHMTYFWTDEELEWINGSELKGNQSWHLTRWSYTRNSRRNEGILGNPFGIDWRKFLSSKDLQKDHPDIFDPKVFTKEKYEWAQAQVWSRSFSDEIDSEETTILIPFVDLLNHNHSAVLSIL